MTNVTPFPSSAQRGFRLTGWHVLAGFVAFFGVTIAVDAVMITQAYKTYPGEVATSPYEVGLSYDRELAQQAAQNALGWRMTAGVTAPGLLTLTVTDAHGAPLHDLGINAGLERPTTVVGRRVLTFRETLPGIYLARTDALDGAWDLKLTALDRQGHRFEAERRLVTP